jgi:ribulose-phosphate 3-epimerase
MNRDPQAAREKLGGPNVSICPSLLNCDFGILAEEIASAGKCGAPCVHWDVMDGEFVPNFTYGPPLIRSLRSQSDLIFDAHLMMQHPEKYLDDFLAAGCDIVTVHLEAVPDPADLLRKIQERGVLAGLAINPPTPVERLDQWIDLVDLVLVMSVMPGFGGQKFDESVLEKIRWVRDRASDRLLIQVDGGVNRSTIQHATQAGARLCVVGSAFYGATNRQVEFDALMALTRV